LGEKNVSFNKDLDRVDQDLGIIEDKDDRSDIFYKKAEILTHKGRKISPLRPKSSLAGKRPISGVQAGPE
jgi:hypothetical protein